MGPGATTRAAGTGIRAGDAGAGAGETGCGTGGADCGTWAAGRASGGAGRATGRDAGGLSAGGAGAGAGAGVGGGGGAAAGVLGAGGGACPSEPWVAASGDTRVVRPQSHSRAVKSEPAVASVRPSGANTTSFTTPLWPVSGSPRGRGSVGSATSHNRAVPSAPAVARTVPSGRTPPNAPGSHGRSSARQASGGGPVGHVPQQHQVLRAGSGQRATVRRERHRPHPAHVHGQGNTEEVGRRGVGDVPQTHLPVLAGGGERTAVRREPEGEHGVVEPRQRGDEARRGRRGDVPQRDNATTRRSAALARMGTSGATARDHTRPEWPPSASPRMRGSAGSATFDNRTALPQPAVARTGLPGANATARTGSG